MASSFRVKKDAKIMRSHPKQDRFGNDSGPSRIAFRESWPLQLRITAHSALNRPIEEWGKLIGDVPSATAILDRFLQTAEVIEISGKSYRLKDRAGRVGGS
jgi:hypothetical protein